MYEGHGSSKGTDDREEDGDDRICACRQDAGDAVVSSSCWPRHRLLLHDHHCRKEDALKDTEHSQKAVQLLLGGAIDLLFHVSDSAPHGLFLCPVLQLKCVGVEMLVVLLHGFGGKQLSVSSELASVRKRRACKQRAHLAVSVHSEKRENRGRQKREILMLIAMICMYVYVSFMFMACLNL